MITTVRRDHQSGRAHTLGETRGDRQHDAVTERHDGAAHRFVGVVPVGNLPAGLQQIGREQLSDEIQRDRPVRHPELARLRDGEWNLALVMLGAVVEAQRRPHIVVPPRPMERGDGIHATGA